MSLENKMLDLDMKHHVSLQPTITNTQKKLLSTIEEKNDENNQKLSNSNESELERAAIPTMNKETSLITLGNAIDNTN